MKLHQMYSGLVKITPVFLPIQWVFAAGLYGACNSETSTPKNSSLSTPTVPKPEPESRNELPEKKPSQEERIASGRELYTRYCKLCHAEDGAGYAADHASQLGNPLFVASATTDLIWFGIEYGRPGTPMAAFGKSQGGPLDEEQIKNIVKYIQSLSYTASEQSSREGNSLKGKVLYATYCSGCHGDSGEGKTGPSLSNPYFLISASNAFLHYAIKYGRPDTPMLPFLHKLDEQQIADVVAFIRTWARTITYGPAEGEPIPALSNLVVNAAGQPSKFKTIKGHYVAASAVNKELQKGSRMVILDARATSDWMSSHIPGAYPVPFYDPLSAELIKAIPRDGTPIVAYCACPHAASDTVAEMLEKAGFSNVFVIDEGVLVWAKRGYPVTFGRSGSQNGSR